MELRARTPLQRPARGSARPPTATTHPHADELIVQYDPGQQVHAAHVDGEQGQRVRGHQDAERVYVQVVGEHPEHAEHGAPGEEVRGGEPAVPEVAHALAEYVRGRLIVWAAQLAEEVQREKQHGPVGAKPRGEKRRVVSHQLQHNTVGTGLQVAVVYTRVYAIIRIVLVRWAYADGGPYPSDTGGKRAAV